MAYRWRPGQTQKETYKEKMELRNEFNFIKSCYPIRVGCYIEFFHNTSGEILKGVVKKSTYGTDGQHTFTIALQDSDKKSKSVKGRNLYNSLLVHKPGDIAKNPNHPLNTK